MQISDGGGNEINYYSECVDRVYGNAYTNTNLSASIVDHIVEQRREILSTIEAVQCTTNKDTIKHISYFEIDRYQTAMKDKSLAYVLFRRNADRPELDNLLAECKKEGKISESAFLPENETANLVKNVNSRYGISTSDIRYINDVISGAVFQTEEDCHNFAQKASMYEQSCKKYFGEVPEEYNCVRFFYIVDIMLSALRRTIV